MASLPTIDVSEAPRPEEYRVLHDLLMDYNRRNSPPTEFLPLALLLRDANGQVVGGLSGRSVYDWLFVELLFVPEPLRGMGLGRALMAKAEEIARQRGCLGIWLDTFEFQARPFYEKLGFRVFGELKDHPRGISQYWLEKRLDAGS